MKKFMITSVLLALLLAGTSMQAQNRQDESLGLPGDNLNLYAVMKLFQSSETLEGFEKNLNDPNSRINNLDLNGDNYVDYIRVLDFVDNDVHTIVLQVAVTQNENQDVAVFTVQRDRNGQVQIQLIGDEALYGRDYIIEPRYDDDNGNLTPNPGYSGNNGNVTVVRTTYVEVASWPVVRFIYMPGYSGWRSSWYFGYYPSYWHTWQPFYWDYYYGYHYNWYNDYYSHYRHAQNYRYTRWNDFYYTGRRSYSTNVYGRIKEGNYKATYSHPEQRRDGEALFTKSHPEQSTRRSDNSSINSSGNSNNSRRNSVQPAQGRQSTGTNTGTTSPRRSENTVNGKSDKGQTKAQSTGTTRRMQTNGADKTVTKPVSVQKRESNRQTPATGSNKSVSKPAPVQKESSARRSSNSVSTKSEAKPTQVRQKTTRASSPSRSNNVSTKAAAPARQSEKGKSSETTTSKTRR